MVRDEKPPLVFSGSDLRQRYMRPLLYSGLVLVDGVRFQLEFAELRDAATYEVRLHMSHSGISKAEGHYIFDECIGLDHLLSDRPVNLRSFIVGRKAQMSLGRQVAEFMEIAATAETHEDNGHLVFRISREEEGIKFSLTFRPGSLQEEITLLLPADSVKSFIK
jgi:hypothetical protein